VDGLKDEIEEEMAPELDTLAANALTLTSGVRVCDGRRMMIKRIKTYMRRSEECAITNTWALTDSKPPISHA